ncbi:uncharacterized protein LOC117123409 [Anneissia japonica]|uniref:uncharacterized protein LOC117123409 n=1 Tax=Anneissia japonica TaxID=1529436 RepID=UPI001425531C|nr:uncharacterized protein LOC117123409 [Anneissia japonica]
MELYLAITLITNLLCIHVASGVIKISADQCDHFINKTSTCYQVHKVGEKAILKININGMHKPDDIKWFRRVKILGKSSPLLLSLEDEGKLPRNMFLSHDRRNLELMKIRNYDMASNSFKVEVKSRQNYINFVIQVHSIDIGPKPHGTSLMIDIKDYIQLPDYATSFYWYIEGAHSILPGNIRLQDERQKLVIKHIEEKDYQMYVCAVYSNKNYFLAKRRFQLLKAQRLTRDPQTFPSTVYRPLGSSIQFKVKVHGVYKPLLKWYKDQRLFTSHHTALLSDDRQLLRIPKIERGMYGTYTCRLQGTDKDSSISVDFQLKKPVIPIEDKVSHNWNFDILRTDEDGVEVLDSATGVSSRGKVSHGCLDIVRGVSSKALVMNMKQKHCDGKLELLDTSAVDECVVDPEVCHEGFSLSIWLKLKPPPPSRKTDVLCTIDPHGLCITCSSGQPDILQCLMDVVTVDQIWQVPFQLHSKRWQFVVVTWSPISECRVFINGEMEGSTLGQSLAEPHVTSQTPFVLGLADKRKPGTSQLRGLVDELLIWHQVVLSPKQVATMYLQFYGLDRPELKEVEYNHTVEMGDSLKLTCPFDIAPVFRSQLHWLEGNREVDKYTGRLSIITPVDMPQVFTCQYFNGSDVVSSKKFFVTVEGYKSALAESSQHTAVISENEEPETDDDSHHQKIQKHLDQIKDDIDFRDYPCLSYPCKHGGTCRQRQHKFKLNGTQHSAYSYQCHCTDKYRGHNCEVEVTSCDAYPCENGKCVDDDATDSGFRCLCYHGYQGDTCSEDINECDDLNDCSPRADCINSHGSYSCKCHAGFEGDGKHCVATVVHVTLRDPGICTSVLAKSKLCIIETDQMRNCDVTFAVDISGMYQQKDVVWSKHWAKLNKNGPTAIEYKVEPTNFMVSDNGTRKGIKCWESDFSENYFVVEVRNGHIPPPSFMFKLVHHSIDLGPQIPGTPLELSVYYYGVFPDNTWTAKWVNEATGNFTIVAPPRLTYEYRVESLKPRDIGFLIYYGYDADGYQVASRTFHDKEDVDECLENSHTCVVEMSECENLPGSYKCVCHTGYQADGATCKDVDECLIDNHCHKSALCTNTAGSYFCTCLEGFHGDGIECTGIDCPLLGDFTNGQIVGLSHSFKSFVRFRCYKGYRLEGSHRLQCLETGIWSALKPECIDVNECEVTNYCDSNAICHNEPGDYRCDCKRGYEGDGMRCIDINECAQPESPCHEHAVCINRDGGFGCTCFHQAISSPLSDCTGSSEYSKDVSNFEETVTAPPLVLQGQSSEKANFADLAEVFPFMEYENFNTSIDFPGRASMGLTQQQLHKGDHVLALEGSSYDIPCIPYSIMNSMVMLDPEYLWIRDRGAKLDPSHYEPSENGNLHFYTVSAQDTGPFKCRISYSDISGDGIKEITYSHQLSVFTTATPLCDISVTYFTEACHHATNYEHRNTFLSSLAKKVCLQVGCTVLEFDMECHRVQENVGANFKSVHQLNYKFTLQVNIREYVLCNVSCIVMQLQSHVGQVLSALDEFVRQEELKSTADNVYRIMSNSWAHSIRFVCREGYAIRDYICVTCPPGSSSKGEACHLCGQGYYQSNFTSRNCTACPHGHVTKSKGSTSLDQCYVEKLGEKILGGIIGGVGTIACILFVIIYRVVVRNCRGSAQDVALRRLSEAVEDTMEMAKDTIKGAADELAFRAEIAKSEYADKRSRKSRKNSNSSVSGKRMSKKKLKSSGSSKELLSKSPSEQSLLSETDSNQESHHVHFPGSSVSVKETDHQVQHTSDTSHNALLVNDVNEQSSHWAEYYNSHNSLMEPWSHHSSHNEPGDTAFGVDSRQKAHSDSTTHFRKNHQIHVQDSNSSKHSELERINFEYSNYKIDEHGHEDAADITHGTLEDEYHSSCEILDSPSFQNLTRVESPGVFRGEGSHQSLPETNARTKDRFREQIPLVKIGQEQKNQTVSQASIRHSLNTNIPIPPPPPPLPDYLAEIDSNTFGFPPPPSNF